MIVHRDASQSLFCLIICRIQQFYWLIILLNNLFRFEKGKKIPVQGKEIAVFLVDALAQSGKSVQKPLLFKKKKSSIRTKNLIVVNLLNGKVYYPNLSHYGFKNRSLT